MEPPLGYTPIPIGTPVRIRGLTSAKGALISEYRGPLGINGRHIYGIYVRRPRPATFEMPEDVLEIDNERLAKIKSRNK